MKKEKPLFTSKSFFILKKRISDKRNEEKIRADNSGEWIVFYILWLEGKGSEDIKRQPNIKKINSMGNKK